MSSLANLGARETSVVSGSAAKRLFSGTNSPQRSLVQVCNHDPVFFIWVKLVPAGAALPTIASTDHDFRIPPGDTAEIPAGHAIDVCILSSSGGAATAAYSALEAK